MGLPKLSSGLAKSCHDKVIGRVRDERQKNPIEWDRCLRVAEMTGDGEEIQSGKQSIK